MAKVRDAISSDLADIVDIHLSSIKPSINSTVGSKRLKYLYEQVLNSRSGFLLVAVEDGRILGFICGTSDYSEFVKESRGQITLRDLYRVFQKLGIKNIAVEIFESLQLHFVLKSIDEAFYMALWGMRSSSSPVAGSELFRELIHRAKEVRPKCLIASVEKGNSRLIRVYKSLGFIESKKLNKLVILNKHLR